jgi:hypothetical protein
MKVQKKHLKSRNSEENKPEKTFPSTSDGSGNVMQRLQVRLRLSFSYQSFTPLNHRRAAIFNEPGKEDPCPDCPSCFSTSSNNDQHPTTTCCCSPRD